MKYFLRGWKDGREMLGSGCSLFGEYANDRNAIRYMGRFAQTWLNRGDSVLAKKPDKVILSRYTNFYDDKTSKTIHTFTKEFDK